MQNGVIIRVQPGEIIPVEHLKAVLDKYQGSWAAAFIQDGVMQIASVEGKASLETLDEIQTMALDLHAIYYFAQGTELQPFTLVARPVNSANTSGTEDEEAEPEIIAFLEGNFKDLTPRGTEKQFSNEALIAGWLERKAIKLCGFLEGDIDKVMAELKDTDSEQEFVNMIVDRGCITIYAINGDVATFAAGAPVHSFPWGTTTDPIGLEVAKEEEQKPEPKGAAALFNKAKAAVASAIKPAAAAAPPPSAPDEKKTTVADAATEMVRWKPKPGSSQSFAKDAYKALLGTLPTKDTSDRAVEWKHFPEVWVNARRLQYCEQMGWKFNRIKSLKDIPPVIASVEPVKQPTSAPPTDTALSGKDVAPHHIGAILPVLSAEQKKAILDGPIVKVLDKNSLTISDPSTYSQMERKHPTLFAQLGKENRIPLWSFEDIREINRKHPEAIEVELFHALLGWHRTDAELAALRANAKLQVVAPKVGGSYGQRKTG